MAYRKISLFCALAIAASAGLVACDSVPRVSADDQYLPPRTGEGLVAKPQSPIGDAPMPVGFVVVESLSRAHTVAGSRTIRHVYQGQATRSDIINFYRSTLPQYQWERKSESITATRVDLAWVKGREVMAVKVTTEGPVATIELNIHNVNDASPKP